MSPEKLSIINCDIVSNTAAVGSAVINGSIYTDLNSILNDEGGILHPAL